MDLVQAVVLGIVQGLAEFLPISSSGHLIMVPFLLGWPEHTTEFDLALHAGTTIALFCYFWRDFLLLAQGFFRGLASDEVRAKDPHWRLAWLVLLGSIPAGLVGVLAEDYIEMLFRTAAINGVLIIVFALILWGADRTGSRMRPLGAVGWRDALIIGMAQVLALMPGVSRSGITITAGLFRGLDRPAAARFSFLLSGPITAAAVIYKLRGGIPEDDLAAFVVGTVVSAVVGWAAIGFLLRYLQRNSLTGFVIYRIVFGTAVLAVAIQRGTWG